MSLGNLIFDFPTDIKRTIRKIEKMYLKINTAMTTIIFNSTCKKEVFFLNTQVCGSVTQWQMEKKTPMPFDGASAKGKLKISSRSYLL